MSTQYQTKHAICKQNGVIFEGISNNLKERKEAAHGDSAIPWQPADPGEQAQPWVQSVKNQFNILDLLCRPYQILS